MGMKRHVSFVILLTIIVCVHSGIYAQSARVEKSVYGFQVGYMGAWVHGEFRLADQVALRTELGIDGYFGGYYGVVMYPEMAVEPRWYYNLNKRESLSKRIDGNSANFISLPIGFYPHTGYFIGNQGFVEGSDVLTISISPTWGIRRNIGKHLNTEAGLGAGYIFHKNYDSWKLNIHLRIGYRF